MQKLEKYKTKRTPTATFYNQLHSNEVECYENHKAWGLSNQTKNLQKMRENGCDPFVTSGCFQGKAEPLSLCVLKDIVFSLKHWGVFC